MHSLLIMFMFTTLEKFSLLFRQFDQFVQDTHTKKHIIQTKNTTHTPQKDHTLTSYNVYV